MKKSKLLTIKQWFRKPFIIVLNRAMCFLFGHKPVVNMLIETKYSIYSKGCQRCKLSLPEFWENIPPPNSTPEQLESWNIYYKITRVLNIE
jgi:hypothetical protein